MTGAGPVMTSDSTMEAYSDPLTLHPSPTRQEGEHGIARNPSPFIPLPTGARGMRLAPAGASSAEKGTRLGAAAPSLT